MALKVAKRKRIVKAIWEAMEREGLCDNYGGSKYRRCELIVIEFVNRISEACNERPTEESAPVITKADAREHFNRTLTQRGVALGWSPPTKPASTKTIDHALAGFSAPTTTTQEEKEKTNRALSALGWSSPTKRHAKK